MDHILAEMQPQLKLIVKAIQKGVGEDVREYKNTTNKATDNAVPFMRADNINTNLRDSVASDSLELKSFKRCSWTGCLLIDRLNKRTITICSKQTLERIPRKTDRRIPHYLQTILHIQNSDVEYVSEQPDLFYYPSENQFSEEEYRLDYAEIMEDEIAFGDGYVHWVVVYEATHYTVNSIAMKKLDQYFRTAQEIKLENLLSPDFRDLTMESSHSDQPKDAHALVSVKPRIHAAVDGVAKQEPIAISKKMKEEEQA